MRPPRSPRRAPEAGLTLVEMLVALAVFAVIGTAGLATLDGILRARERTEGRLETLAGLQRSLHLVATDLMQAAGGSLAATEGALSLRRQRGPAIGYTLEQGALVRRVAAAPGAAPVRQVLLAGASDLAWRFFTPEQGWTEEWPPADADPPETERLGASPPDATPPNATPPEAAPSEAAPFEAPPPSGSDRATDGTARNPKAVELTVLFDGPGGGTLRRLAILPAEVSP